jgi:MFS family permease
MGKATMKGNGQTLRAAGIILIACACGWFIMELEILGVRILAPYFGSAVYVVTGSVIGVFLLSMAIGYLLGGWLCDRIDIRTGLGIVMAASGAWMGAMPFFIDPVCDMIFNLELDEKWGSLLASLLLFGTPTMLLGTASPSVVHWLTGEARQTGFNAGLVLAASTVASFAGCVVTAFYLVLFSLRTTLCVSGAILAAMGGMLLVTAAVWGKQKADNRGEGKLL